MSEPGSIEIDRSGTEPLVSIEHPPGPFTLDQLRAYASYLTLVADEAARRPEPEVDELVAVIDGSRARWMPYEEGVRRLAREILDAGYERKNAATEKAG